MNYYKQGDAANADKIKAAFERLGLNVCGHRFMDESTLYYTHPEYNYVLYVKCGNGLDHIIKTHPDYQELELPSEPKFKVGDWLVYNDGDTFCLGARTVQVKTVEKDRYIFTQDTTGSRRFTDNHCRLWSIADARDGDILATDNGWTCIFQAFDGCGFSSYCFMDSQKWFCELGSEAHTLDSRINGNIHPTNKEQCNQFFTKMKEAGYTWDAEKKELKKIAKPKFKVGDSLQSGSYWAKVKRIDTEKQWYICDFDNVIPFEEQELWSLVPNSNPHYDIANFKPKQWVLVRDDDEWEWALTRFSHLSNGSASLFVCINGASFQQCIPFERNEHLLGTTDPCGEEFINW